MTLRTTLPSTAHGLILARFHAFSAGDFAFIYDSYHPAALFREFFPDRDEYLAYAMKELSRHYRIIDCRILRQDDRQSDAYLLFKQTVADSTGIRTVYEVGHCLLSAGTWFYMGGMKLDLPPEELAVLTWEEILAAGDGIWV